jgi:catechol 2,3-dioxygenase-like lactoylglutathione lyase family enzyme
MTKAAGSIEIDFEGATPILRVENLAASVDYYVDVLGFRLDWQEPGVFASVTREKTSIFLCEKDQGHAGGWIWIGVSDAGALHQDYTRRGARIRHPPTNYAWAYEMQVEDLDGNVLRMGSECREGEPVGEWLDMRGDRWVRSADGDGWTRLARG